jgi:hypothetical protein
MSQSKAARLAAIKVVIVVMGLWEAWELATLSSVGIGHAIICPPQCAA